MDRKMLGLKIKELRSKYSTKIGMKFTGQMLADKIGISRSYLGDIENGRILATDEILSKIAEACEVPVSYFDDVDQVLLSLIETDCPEMDPDEKKDFFIYAKNTILNGPDDIELDINLLKLLYTDAKRGEISNGAIREDYKRQIEFSNPEEALKFILSQPSFMAYGGYDLNALSDDEILEIANDMLFAMKLSLEKIKKKNK